ncbi:MAG: hypothetical protein CXT72_01855 [Methanobacteriota archaeon]|jgi:hypothetical protein|nr:MAG: hypothetical protein CXT72_01855 [Euryarchaeota archaeon]HIE63476.1 hypothetical protein [Candidatus Poseidoniales archaeon]HIL00239.1 hypothetical protein [Candidatus Poseidoniales archaeon]
MTVSNRVEWRFHAVLGFVLLLNTLVTKISFSQPWGSESFTLGVLSVAGLFFLYVAWYRITFDRKGLIPWLDQWDNPAKSSANEFAVSLFVIIMAYYIGRNNLPLPNPTALILLLIGLLMLIHSIYVILSIGILADN